MTGRAGTGAPIDICQREYPRLLDAARRIARPLGYAIGVHGSMLYDLDLIAAPWSHPCVPPHELAARLARGLRRIAPVAPICLLARGRRPAREQGNPKPHGRVAFTLIMCRHLHIDLSVMPPLPEPAP